MNHNINSKNLVLLEKEAGVVEGCNPSPWAPCVYPQTNFRCEYTVERFFYSSCNCGKSELKSEHDTMLENNLEREKLL